jgi:hypothetical protein
MKPQLTDDLVRSMAQVDDDALAGAVGRPAARSLLEDVMASAPSGEHGTGRAPRRRRRWFRSPGFGLQLVALGTMAAAVVAGAAFLETSGGTDEARDTSPIVYGITLSSAAEAAEVLDRAADVAEDRAFTPPRSRQWVYTKMSHTTSVNAGGGVVSGPYKTHTWELWRRVDGKRYAAYENGKISVGRESTTPSRAARYDPLPSDPEALLRKVGGGKAYHDMTFLTLITILKDSVHPPRTEAAIFRAIRLIPGVRLVKGRVDAAGRPAIALGLVQRGGWLHEEVLLDPKTYIYLGERSITIADHTSGGDGEPKQVVRKGTLQRIEVRHSVGIVDEPGRRP